jgi:hypothetical protein
MPTAGLGDLTRRVEDGHRFKNPTFAGRIVALKTQKFG